MAGHLLLVVLLCFFSEMKAQALLPPKLTVNPPVITERDLVTLNCQTPSSVSVSRCYFKLGQGSMKVFSCMKTLTGTKLLKMSNQRSPAEVKIDCFYVVKVGYANSTSPHSDTSSIFIHSQTPQMSLQHFHGEYVLFTCSLPGSADHDMRCNLYFGESSRPVQTTTIRGKTTLTNQWFCQFIVTIDDLLSRLRSVQQSDASCDYTLGGEPGSLSPRSDGHSLSDIVEKESVMLTTKSPFAVTTVDQTLHESSTETSMSPVTPPDPAPVDQTLHESSTETSLSSVTPPNPAPDQTLHESSTKATLSPNPAPDMTVSSPGGSTFVSPVTPSSDIVEEESWMTQTVMMFTMTTGLTVSMPHVTTPETPAKQTSDQTLHESSTKASLSPNPARETKLLKWKIWTLVIVVAGFGIIVGVTFVGVTLLCTKRRTERYSDKRTQANVTDDVMCMQSLDHGGLLPAGNDEAYSVIASVPGADCPAGSKKLDGQRPQNEDSDIYHVYASIPEESSSSALNVVYSTVQAH